LCTRGVGDVRAQTIHSIGVEMQSSGGLDKVKWPEVGLVSVRCDTGMITTKKGKQGNVPISLAAPLNTIVLLCVQLTGKQSAIATRLVMH
jgi:hypothetical protein